MFGEEPGKQKTRSCRTQELARSSAQENEGRKRPEPDSPRIERGSGPLMESESGD
jgi:hypothetical protein